MFKLPKDTNKPECDFVSALIQHRGIEPGDGKPWGSYEGPECHHSIWVWVLSMFLVLRCWICFSWWEQELWPARWFSVNCGLIIVKLVSEPCDRKCDVCSEVQIWF